MINYRELEVWLILGFVVSLVSWWEMPEITPLIITIAVFILVIVATYHSTIQWSLAKWINRSFYLASVFFIIYTYFLVDFEIIQRVFSTIAIVFFLLITTAYSFK